MRATSYLKRFYGCEPAGGISEESKDAGRPVPPAEEPAAVSTGSGS